MTRLRWINVIGYAVVLTVNTLANALPINGITSGEVSDRYPTLVTPAGYVFTIWGVIYALLAVFVVYQALPSQRDDARLRRLGGAFAISCACNAAWLFAWHYQVIALSWILIATLLITLAVCYERLRGPVESWREYVAVRLSFSVYLGWVTVATVANTAVLLVDVGIEGGQAWGVAAIVAASLVGAAMLVRRGDAVVAAVLVWSLIGIAVRQSDSAAVVIVAVVAASLLAVAAVAITARDRSAVASGV